MTRPIMPNIRGPTFAPEWLNSQVQFQLFVSLWGSDPISDNLLALDFPKAVGTAQQICAAPDSINHIDEKLAQVMPTQTHAHGIFSWTPCIQTP